MSLEDLPVFTPRELVQVVELPVVERVEISTSQNEVKKMVYVVGRMKVESGSLLVYSSEAHMKDSQLFAKGPGWTLITDQKYKTLSVE